MKWKNLYYTLLLTSSLIGNATAQQRKDYEILLRSGSFVPQQNVASAGSRTSAAFRLANDGQKSFVIIQFDDIPTEDERRELKREGIELLEYLPNYAYTATIGAGSNPGALARTRGRAIIELNAEQKMEPSLANGRIPSHAFVSPTTVDLWISYPRSFSYEEIKAALQARGVEIVADDFKKYQVLTVRIPAKELKSLASQPFIQYVQALPQPDRQLNSKSTVNGRANVLKSALPGNRNLSGAGVVVGIGDESNPLRHIDFNTRIINRAPIDGGSHGLHVMGTMAGAGIMEERNAGYAPKATVVAQSYSSILAYSPQYVQDFGMVITNNSYGSDVVTCETNGVYDLYSYILDQQAFDMPYLQHVFAAGNSGKITCAPFAAGFATVLGGYQTAKNVITVGATNETSAIYSESSRGPVKDGRVKPEITAQGSVIVSTVPTNLYTNGSGTSMSSPAVSGGLALLYERYRQLNGNQNPKNGLMKALLVNGAVDRGNEGPDYRFGFGWLNLLRSVKMLESQSYKTDQVSHQGINNFAIDVPAGTAQLKVMLYWNDPAGSMLVSKNLVHNLDLQVINPSSNAVNPRILNPAAAQVNAVAGTGVDNVNNMEQVVINNPAQGSYTISVKGSTIGQSPSQEYFVVYDIIPNSITLTNPVGGERMKDGDATLISWDAFGNSNSTFTVQYSVNDGQNWTNISTSVAAGTSQLNWVVPAGTKSEKVRVRVTQNSTGAQSVSEPFTVIGVPGVTLSSLQCEGYISVDWTAVSGATDYEVMVLKGSEMVPVATTTGVNYTFSGLSKDSTHYVSVRARINGKPGRRALAISRKPDTGTCAGSISDNDLKVESILTPASSGRKNTSSALTSAVFVKIRIKNLDDVDFNGPLDVGYLLNGMAVPVETINPFIEKGKTYDHTFAVGANLADVGNYTFKVYIHGNQDLVAANDTITKTFRQLPNDPIALPYEDNMENLPVQSVTLTQMGLTGDGRYDFSASSNDAGRIRTFVNSGFAASGQKALTLDTNRPFPVGNTTYLTATYNLGEYDINTHDLRLVFSYKNHGQKSNDNNRVWIRGKDSDTWIELYNLFANQNLSTEGYKTTVPLEMSGLLAANAKNFSSSFQVRWGQWGKMLTSDYSNGAGYSFDDIRIISVTDDIQMISLLAPPTESCGLGNAESIAVRIRNSSARDISDIPLVLSLPDGTVILDTIPLIAKRSTIDFTFNQKADLSEIGALDIKAWAALPTDSFRDNDTLSVKVFNAPVLSTFPYLEDFENGDGFWSAKGTNSSWQYGTPVSSVVNKAASGTKIWKTNLSGGHNDKEESYLYSPCFNVSSLTSPTLSFSAAIDLEVCEPTPCDYVYVEYSGNNGPWTRLGAVGQGTNWYNKTYSGKGAWALQNYVRWHVASMALPTGFTNLKIRFVLISDGFTHREGIALDDIHIFDNVSPIHDSSNGVATQQVSGSGWVNFVQNGKMLASINANGQSMGNTEVRSYVNTTGVRNGNGHYYLDRNFTIKPANANLANFATVRFYFLETESEALINAVGCASCGKPANAFELGISQYSNPINTSKEDGSLINSTEGGWTYHPAEEVKLVPYDKGYYLEMSMKTFSEFWIAKGFVGNPGALPVELVNFNARKKQDAEQSKDVIVEWETASEENFDHFAIEVAAGDDAYRQGRFVPLVQIAGGGGLKDGKKYEYTDETPGKWGNRYYRLKMVDIDSTYQYSRVRTVAFDAQSQWAVYPNPSKGVFYLGNEVPSGQATSVNVYDLYGRILKQVKGESLNAEAKRKIDISGQEFGEGIYVLEVVNGETKQAFQVLKN
ncbi:S8 family serine peptidase [Dyadobacter fermentans]|uniref:Peptidase S8 and S53 subtilisin kexin sedolisin n=1 Tax=Dyadobacter fermentans (strain ATCC 700827 / DSM 18053 / CIP 107007 / KCTC 52180 / NS114) TaxID=471854 RepID=C6W1U9_DYAFD|nr:S8 family serine peptidase [Dyadobacter fermentans]ACT95524.1 peptidase S8 and S53 subtilisin kexin sedolisin [Dyadobacter fermentans DSM 18053]